MDGDETPQLSTSHTGMAIFNLPVPLGIQPGTFGGLLAPLCSRHPPDANTVRVSTATQCVRRQLGLSRLARMLDHVGRAKRRSNPKARQAQPSERQQAPVQRLRPAKRVSGLSPSQVLERIERARAMQEKAEAELAVLVDQAVKLDISWPEIATRLGVSRQAARQHYQRRHRDDTSSGSASDRAV